MIVIILIAILMSGGVVAWLLTRWSVMLARWISLIAVGICFLVVLNFWLTHLPTLDVVESTWVLQFQQTWIPALGISLSFALDGLSLLMLLLTFLLGILAVLISWKEIQYRVGFFHFNLLWVLAGITGVFATMDLFLFYFFWELALIPVYFLCSQWGGERRIPVTFKFFIYTFTGSVLMLIGLLYLYFQTPDRSFSIESFYNLDIPVKDQLFIFWLLFAAFAVKMPVFPFHT